VPRLGAWIDRQRPETYEGWELGFNGQGARVRMIDHLVKSLVFEAFVETGTFRGRTAALVRGRYTLPVWTVELNRRSYELDRWRFRSDPDVHLHVGDSRPFLRSMTDRLAGKRCLFYLDAHWYDDLPLADELRIISAAWPDFVVIVDDFKVEGDHKYYFDDYGPGKQLSLENLPLDEMPDVRIWFPSTPGVEENYPYRGCVVLARGPSVVGAVEACPLLREHTTSADPV
jgi:hypothetical protein